MSSINYQIETLSKKARRLASEMNLIADQLADLRVPLRPETDSPRCPECKSKDIVFRKKINGFRCNKCGIAFDSNGNKIPD